MQYLSSGSDDLNQGLTSAADDTVFAEPVPLAYGAANTLESDPGTKVNPLDLIRRYWLLAAVLMLVGAAVGFGTVVLSAPKYRSRLLLEIQNANGNLPRGTIDGGGSYEENEVNVETQIGILKSDSFLKRGAARTQSDNLPIAPTRTDLFARLRQRIRPATTDPVEAEAKGLNIAIGSFNAQPVNKTRLIELSCESTSPEVAAQFLNSMAAEFSDYSSQSRTQTALHTGEWLAAQIEDSKSKVQEAEDHLRDFIAASGNVFAGQDTTLEDTKLFQLKGELAKIQAERIQRQTRYELTKNNPPESLAEVLDDPVLRNYQQQLESSEARPGSA